MRPLTLLLLLWSVVCLALRLECARAVDFGDSEALYAAYSLFPAPSFVDHPGLIGTIYAMFGKPPDAHAVHTATAISASLFPWLLRAALLFSAGHAPLGADGKRLYADRASLIALWFALVPVVSIGLFALTPDWPLALCLTAGMGFALRAERSEERRSVHMLAAGALFALAGFAKLTGFAFLIALAFTWLRPSHGIRSRTAGWVGVGLGLAPSVEMAVHEAKHGFPMLSHRLAPSALGVAKGLGMATVGQLLYLSPILAVLIGVFAWRTVRRGASRQLAALIVIPGALLVLAAALSPQAEPHWMAPVLVPLAFAAFGDPDSAGEAATLERYCASWLVRAAFGLAAVCTLVVYGWVLVPQASRWISQGQRQNDISRELFGQNILQDALRHTATELGQEGVTPVFVGPHWTLCARIRLALPQHRFEVGCATRERDDFDTWAPAVWEGAPLVVWVTDDRFEDVDAVGGDLAGKGTSPLPAALAGYKQLSKERVRVFRGGAPSRTFVWRVLQLPAP